jgi:hypothetical protein
MLTANGNLLFTFNNGKIQKVPMLIEDLTGKVIYPGYWRDYSPGWFLM